MLWPLVLLVKVRWTQGRTSGSEESTVMENKLWDYAPENRSPASGVNWGFAGRSRHVPGSSVGYRAWTEDRHPLCNGRMYFHTTAVWGTSKCVYPRIHYKKKSYSRWSKWRAPSARVHVLQDRTLICNRPYLCSYVSYTRQDQPNLFGTSVSIQ